MKSSILKLTIALSILSLSLIACTGNQSESDQQSDASAGEKAPDFEVTTIDGETISLSQSLDNDKPLVVYFTASWCPTCARNWPAMSEVYPEFEDRLTMVAISIDPTDTEDVILKLSEERNFRFPSTAGRPDVMIDFGVSGQATTVGVDREGYIVFKKAGEALSVDEFRELFTSLVN
jgi:peroxiredoxin